MQIFFDILYLYFNPSSGEKSQSHPQSFILDIVSIKIRKTRIVIINKKIYHGRHNAAEFGHITINYNGPRSRCKNNGCIETHVSARGITRLYDQKSEPQVIQNLAFKGNKKAIAAYDKMGYYLGIGLTNIIYALDPDIIIIGGKIANSWKLFSKTMNKTIKEKYFTKPCKIVKSNLKEAGILGAAALVM